VVFFWTSKPAANIWFLYLSIFVKQFHRSFRVCLLRMITSLNVFVKVFEIQTSYPNWLIHFSSRLWSIFRRLLKMTVQVKCVKVTYTEIQRVEIWFPSINNRQFSFQKVFYLTPHFQKCFSSMANLGVISSCHIVFKRMGVMLNSFLLNQLQWII